MCSACGYESVKWIGRCPGCNNWNTFTEEIERTTAPGRVINRGATSPSKLSEIESTNLLRVKTGIEEFDRVLGGGFVPGSVILLGGEPGIGKSTLLLQSVYKLKFPVLYVTGEESLQQIKMRAQRLGIKSDNLFILAETSLEIIFDGIDKIKPGLVVIDSIQTIHNPQFENSPGTVTQIRECTNSLMEKTKRSGFATMIIGHINKDGVIAGPKILEHIVDTVLQFEGDSKSSHRLVRALKNRFGSANELGVFEMHEDGLKEVKEPGLLFVNDRLTQIPGTVITAAYEGSRAVLVEVQALVTVSFFGNPQRVTTGYDNRKLSIILAVLEKRGGLRLSDKNVFVNVAGGLYLDEPAADLAVACAIVSALTDNRFQSGTVIFGELGLGGEIRTVSNTAKRLIESERLGLENAIIPKAPKDDLKNVKLNLNICTHIKEVINLLPPTAKGS